MSIFGRREHSSRAVAFTDGNKDFATTLPFPLNHIFAWIASLTWSSPAKGAYSSVFAAASPVVKEKAAEYGGAYMNADTTPGKVGTPSVESWDDELADELWQTTETLLGELGVWEGDGLSTSQ